MASTPDDPNEPSGKSGAAELAKNAGLALVKSAAAIVPPVGVAVAIAEHAVRMARALKVDMERVQLAALSDEVARLHEHIVHLESRVTEPVEVMELVLNAMNTYPAVLRREKRRLLTNTLVNGVADDPWNGSRTRYFLSAMTSLEPEHIHALRRYATETLFKPNGIFEAPAGTLEAGYLYQLHTWQFLGTPRHADAPGTFEVTRLGAEFLVHLWEPEAGENLYARWPSLVDVRGQCLSIYSGFWADLRELRRFEIDDGKIYLWAEHKDGHDVRVSEDEIRAQAQAWRTAPRI